MTFAMPGSARTRMASPYCLQGCGILRSFRILTPRLRSVQRHHHLYSRTDTADRRSLGAVNSIPITSQMYSRNRVDDARTMHCKPLQLQTASARAQRSFAAAAANTSSSATTSEQDSSPSKMYIAVRNISRTAAEASWSCSHSHIRLLTLLAA